MKNLSHGRKGISRRYGDSFFAIFTRKINQDMKLEDLPYLPDAEVVTDRNELRLSENERHYSFLKQLTLDGAPLNCTIVNKNNIPAIRTKVNNYGHFIPLFPEIEHFILRYLYTGINTDYPECPSNGKLPSNRYVGGDYIYRHIKREIDRNDYICDEEEQDGIFGIRFKANYPYGSIDYGFLPYSMEAFEERLEHTEPFKFICEPCDIPELNNTELSTEHVYIKEKQRLSDIFPDGIPSNTIIDKTVCGIGATYLEIHTDRDSIIIEPNVPVIIGKMEQHSQIIGVFGEKMKQKDIADKVRNAQGHVKIMTTPDSYMKVTAALKSIGIDYRNNYFLLFDECEKLVSDIDYRPNLALPIDDFFKFANKSMVSATPIVVNDPRFTGQGFKIIKVRPEYDHKQILELKPTNNVNAMLRKTLERIGDEPMKCIFYNSVTGIRDLIDYLGIVDKSNIYCSTESSKELKRSGYNVYDSITDKLNRYNFFTSRFYSAVDIVLDEKPVVIMITQVHKTVKGKMPYSLIDPETEAIQIAGRFRNGISRYIHITDTDNNLDYDDREFLEHRLQGEHQGYLKLLQLCKDAEDTGEKLALEQARTRINYYEQGFVNDNGEVNYFRYNNAYIDERLKMIYQYPAHLYKAYHRTGAFIVASESEYAIMTEEEKKKLNDTSIPKAERIANLFECYKKVTETDEYTDWLYLRQYIDELKHDFPLYMEAFSTIGYAKVKELNFKDSDITTAVNDFKYRRDTTSQKVKDAVYNSFTENTIYKISEIKSKLKEIYDSAGLELHRQPQGQDICLYFEATEKRNGKARGWYLGKKIENQ